MILLSSLIIGLNSLVSGTIRKSAAAKENLETGNTLDSAMDIGKAIILGNVSLSTQNSSKIVFRGEPIGCSEGGGNAVAHIEIQDVAGLVDLRFASDQLLAKIVGRYNDGRAPQAQIALIQENARSQKFKSAEDVLRAAGIPSERADDIAALTTIHGRTARLARNVVPNELLAIIDQQLPSDQTLFGASPTNSVFRLKVFVDGSNYSKLAVMTFDYGNGANFRMNFVKTVKRQKRFRMGNTGLSLSARQDAIDCKKL